MRLKISSHPRLAAIAIGFLFFLNLPAQAQPSTLAPLAPRTDGSNQWLDIRELGVEGRGWNDTKSFYDRLPARAEGVVRKPVWDLSRDSAGMCVRFVTDATEIRARWDLTDSWLYQQNATAIGVSG